MYCQITPARALNKRTGASALLSTDQFEPICTGVGRKPRAWQIQRSS